MTILNQNDQRQVALDYHKQLTDHARAYLHRRGIPDTIICRYRIGWNGDRITLPITDRHKHVVFFVLAIDADDSVNSETTNSTGAYPELYGWERITSERDHLVICGSEFERLVLEANGFPAIAATGGARVFLPEWIEALNEIPHVYVCFQNDAAGHDAAGGLVSTIATARVLALPPEVGLGGNVEDFFVRLGKSREEFLHLLRESLRHEPEISDDAYGE